jgi:hypothetical protein
MTDIICRSREEDRATRAKLLAALKKRKPRIRTHNPSCYLVSVWGGDDLISIGSNTDLTIEQAKQLHLYLGEAIAAAEANVGRTEEREDDDFYVSCLIDVEHMTST